MDKMIHYRELIQNQLQHTANLINRQYVADDGEGVAHCVFDEARDEYALIKTGWRKGRRCHGTSLYVRICAGRIQIEEDWTEEGLANTLLEAGVPEEDIVLGFQAPSERVSQTELSPR